MNASSDARLNGLTDLYEIADENSVADFVSHHPEVHELLKEAPAEIRRFFPRASLALELKNSHVKPDVRQLVIVIAPQMHADKALEKLDEMDHQWWTARSEPLGMAVTLNLEL